MTKSKKEPVSRDMGTTEMARRFTVVPKIDASNTWHGKVMDETEIDRLLLKDIITPAEHSVLEALMKKLHKMGFVGVKSPDYSSPIHADATAVGDKRAQSIRGMVRIIRDLDKEIGTHFRVSLVNLCLIDMPWPHSTDDLKSSIKRLMMIIS